MILVLTANFTAQRPLTELAWYVERIKQQNIQM
jgi:hypothetical protein